MMLATMLWATLIDLLSREVSNSPSRRPLNGLADEARTSLVGRSAPALLTCHGRNRLLLERAFVGGRSALFEE
jgi:hypothetical protein